MTDAVKAVSVTLFRGSRFGGEYMSERWMDAIQPKPQDNRSGAEIAADVIKRGRLKVVRS